MRYFYIYMTIHPETKEFYIGRRTSSLSPEKDINYRGSSKTWYRKLSKHTIENVLVKEILQEYESSEDLNIGEIEWITKHINNELCKNAYIPGKGFHNIEKSSEETKKKLSIIAKNRSDETKRKISETKKGKILTEEHKKKVSESLKGREFTEEHKENLSKSGKGRIFTEEHKKKLKEREFNDDWKKKLSDSAKKRIGYIWINNGIVRTRIKSEELEKYLESGWKRGKSIK